MNRKRRMASLALGFLLLCTLLPQPLRAAQTVYFTSVNDMLLELSDDTMPFWQGSTLYVAGTVFDRSKTDLGTNFSRSRDKMTAILYRSREVLVFDLAAGTIENNSTHEILSGSAVVRGDTVFLPVNTVAKFFGFDYSCVKVDYGYLVRIKDETVVLSDSAFIDAASAPMALRYNQYQKAHTPTEESEKSEESKSTGESGVAYLLIEVSEREATEKLLASLSDSGAAATFLLSAQEIARMPDLVRHMIAAGDGIALKIDASGSEKAVLSAIEQANEALWTAGNLKTHLVLLQNAAAGVAEKVAAAGYCPLSAELDYSGALPTSSRTASAVSSLAGKAGRCVALLGEDTAAREIIGGLLSILRTSGCSVRRLNEVAALS